MPLLEIKALGMFEADLNHCLTFNCNLRNDSNGDRVNSEEEPIAGRFSEQMYFGELHVPFFDPRGKTAVEKKQLDETICNCKKNNDKSNFLLWRIPFI